MKAITRVALLDIFHHRRLVIVMALIFSVAFSGFLTLTGYQAALEAQFQDGLGKWLIVYEAGTNSEFFGSRISEEVSTQLSRLGIQMAVPEIHAYTGTSAQNITLLRGIDPNQYTQVLAFEMIEGRRITLQDEPRHAMVGWRLADKLELSAGSTVKVRGRDFLVSGIFVTHTYADNEVWIKLNEAQQLLGWGSDVSLFLIPEQEILREGETLTGGLAVSRQGASLQSSVRHFYPILDLLGVAVISMGIAGALVLTNVLLRLAWMHRRELAILRSIGFTAVHLTCYLLVQASAVLVTGAMLGLGITFAIQHAFQVNVAGFTLQPVVNLKVLGAAALSIFSIWIISFLGPMLWINRLNTADLLRNT